MKRCSGKYPANIQENTHYIATSNGNVKYRLRENGTAYAVTHINDLEKKFPDVDMENL